MSDAVRFPTTRLHPANVEKMQRARSARNTSMAALMDDVLARLIFDDEGNLVGVRPDITDQQELPLQTAS
ncbi:hypothetical protein [Kineococcus xinjiangensis]|uniref:hypothetical protein n=1 Tax=Kineococcus xinjiangensis TaxID=512762 RepID=UPI0011AFFD6F|nr:hypothetical protein [Kineococcus xinjiangensis]